ncbi:MAG: response regulator [Candidatus Zixiibacteriota bacterium]
MAYNILIVDDSKTIRSMLEKVINLSGVSLGEIKTAGNGKEALDSLKDNWIDLVLTDINMPVMGGMELIRAMAGDSMLKSIPVVVISSDGSTQRIKEVEEFGVSHYLRKPFTPEEVGQVIRTILEEPDGQANAGK